MNASDDLHPQPAAVDEEAAETSEEALAKRKEKYKAKLEQRKAREAATAAGEKSGVGNMLGSMPASDSAPNGGQSQPSLAVGSVEDAATSEDVNAQRKAKYVAKLAERKAREAAAAENPTGGSEKSEAGTMLNAAPASDPVTGGGSAAAPRPTESTTSTKTPAASPASTFKITKLRERKAALLKEKDDRAKAGASGLPLLDAGPQPPPIVGNDSEDAATLEDVNAQRKAKYVARLAERKAREAAAAENSSGGSNSEKAEAISSMLNTAPASDSGAGADLQPQPPPVTGSNEDVATSEDVNAQRKAKFFAKLAERKAREAAAAAAENSYGGSNSEKTEASSSMLNTAPASDAVVGDVSGAGSQPTPLVARMQRRQRKAARDVYLDVEGEDFEKPLLQEQQPSTAAALSEDLSLDDLPDS